MERMLMHALTGISGSTPEPFRAGGIGSFQHTGMN